MIAWNQYSKETPQEQPDSQAEDELELAVEKVLAGHYIKFCDYSEEKAVIADYAERLATERAIAELKKLHRSQGKDLPQRDYDNETDEIIDERIANLEAGSGEAQ